MTIGGVIMASIGYGGALLMMAVAVISVVRRDYDSLLIGLLIAFILAGVTSCATGV